VDRSRSGGDGRTVSDVGDLPILDRAVGAPTDVGAYRSLAAGLRITRRCGLGRRRPLPQRPVHAAGAGAARTLCGQPVDELLELGRRLFPFEGFKPADRCRACDDLSGCPALDPGPILPPTSAPRTGAHAGNAAGGTLHRPVGAGTAWS
jgi:hypothetical protein